MASNIDNARKSMAKVTNNRIGTFSMLLNSNETQINFQNRNGIPIENENAINETSDDNSCSPTINVNPLSIQKSKTNSSTKTCNKTQLN